MSAWAKPGVKCVCINAGPFQRNPIGVRRDLVEGRTYTIREVGFDDEGPCVWLREVRRPVKRLLLWKASEAPFYLARFRPLAYPGQSLEADVSKFKPLLTTPERERA